ncbi:Ovarian cancer-associated protein 2 [Coemansia sp. RSA 989]|nr:serine hydrolase FSH [Coemansia mojavensis]KAJ1862850.1 Ovarian cancer-associated protein 2 [Coemansia sp. RSA 989]KAJ1870621.1 Ovarian cancer-associated protein 2 [Coemansia sp. RSA 990]KAJ2672466.1 Ovarian cancer-associated protein 2 [Coemansia sp. RSA 1085]
MQQPKALRVLCLHGYTQNAQKFRDRTGPFRRSLKRMLDLVYVTAPHTAADFDFADTEDTNGPAAAWWNRSSSSPWGEVEASVRFLNRTMRAHGPFDAVVGFSQGAGMAAILLALMQAAHCDKPIKDPQLHLLVKELDGCKLPRFALLFAGFYPDFSQFDSLIRGDQGPIQVPSLHVVGRQDAIVPMDRGIQLASQGFVGAQTEEHEGGHFMPSNAAWRKRYQQFIEQLLLN